MLEAILIILTGCEAVRIIQNAISLHRQSKAIDKALDGIDITDEDIEMQRKAYRLIVERLEKDEN